MGAAGCTRHLTQMIHARLTTRPNRGQNEKSERETEAQWALPQETISIVMSGTSTRTVGHKTPPAVVNAMSAC